MDFERYAISNQREKLAVRVYRSQEMTQSPAVLLCNGFCSIQDVLLPDIAAQFAQAGYHAITFDYRGFGDSEGEPGRVVPACQIEDIISVLQWCQSQEFIDPARIGLWGTSLGGCHVFEVAVRHPDVKCIISQMAFADGEFLVTQDMEPNEKKRFMATLTRMARKKKLTGEELLVPIIKVMTDEESRIFFKQLKKDYPASDITIPYLTVLEAILYRPAEAAAQVLQPTLVMLAEKDKVVPVANGIALYQAITAEKSCRIQLNASHYDMFRPPHLPEVAAQEIEWLRAHL